MTIIIHVKINIVTTIIVVVIITNIINHIIKNFLVIILNHITIIPFATITAIVPIPIITSHQELLSILLCNQKHNRFAIVINSIPANIKSISP